MARDRDKRAQSNSESISRVLQTLVAILLASGFGALVARMAQARVPQEPPLALHEPEAEEPSRYERQDLPTTPIWKITGGFLVMMLFILLVITALQYWFMGYVAAPYPQPPNLNVPANVTLPPEPRFESEPGRTLREIQARDNAQLNGYGWIDQNAGIAHIPIQRAMELIQSRLPVAPEDASKRFEDAGNFLPSSSSSGRVPEKVYP